MRSMLTRLLAFVATTILMLNLVGCAVGTGSKSCKCNCHGPTTQCAAADHAKCDHAK